MKSILDEDVTVCLFGPMWTCLSSLLMTVSSLQWVSVTWNRALIALAVGLGG